ncbi:MAG: ATP-grasp domain-containing protein [Alphaproteobacteria bacterium]
MKSIAVLVSDNMLPDAAEKREDLFELEEEMGKIVPAFASMGMKVDLVRWREAAEKAPNYDAMLPLFVWDYFEGNEIAFIEEMKEAEKHTRLYNAKHILRWNSNKAYLTELANNGAPSILTYNLDRVTQAGIAKAFAYLEADKIVIKPQVGGGAWRQVLFTKGDPFPDKNDLPPGAAMVQTFLPSVTTEGEYSFLYFGGQFSHALIKRPKDGDYRIQSIYGGTEETYHPTSVEKNSARAVLNALDYTPLYARIDLIRGLNGRLKLIELEMIEPYLYLSHAEGEGGENKGALKLAAALLKRLEK